MKSETALSDVISYDSVSKKFIKYLKNHYQMYLLLVPGLIFLVIFKFLPLIGLTMAFKDFQILLGNNILDSIFKSPWVGLDIFRRIFSSQDFISVLGNTLIISVLKIVFLFPLPIILAILLNEVKNRAFKKTVQTVVYLPYFLSWVVVFGLFFTLMGNEGVLNNLLSQFGFEKVNFFTDKELFRPLLIISAGWKDTGWDSIIYMAAITAINTELYEAAVVDGANKFKQIWHITIPGILPVIILMLILRVGYILNAGFEQIFAMYNPAVYDVADIIDTYIYRKGLGQMDFSLGTALGLFNSVIAFVLITSCNFISRKSTGKGIW
ncbi:ABC transporter permease [Ruminiclostridium cellobioparum]|jgi:putative aldouronate transport system permease protein|uniref:ABC transporter permease n=1 Tax=Ruminiclostridium cellobioparum TaxID=29355 RepID=UPI0006857F03|nr:ABC transporter permease subunit [Ruminiclostridium cellobioparum]